MSVKRRRTTLTTGTDGASTLTQGSLSLGAAYGVLLKLEFKGDDTNVDTDVAWTVTDAEGRLILTLPSAFDAGPDDSTVKATNQVYSTVGRAIFPTALETDVYDPAGDPMATGEGGAPPQVVASPLAFSQTGGTDGDVFQITAYVLV